MIVGLEWTGGSAWVNMSYAEYRQERRELLRTGTDQRLALRRISNQYGRIGSCAGADAWLIEGAVK